MLHRYSLISVRRFRKLRYLHRKAFKFFSNPDLWVRVRQQAQDRRVKLFWIKSHQTAQVDLGLPRWAFRANQLADALAGEASSRVEESLQHSLDREYNSWLDSRTWRLQKLLLERASFWLQQGQLVSTKQFGPKAPSKLQILNHLSETHATHQWGPASASGQRACNGCGLAVSSKWAKQKLLWVASLPCLQSGHDLRLLGVHTSHELLRDAASWRCRGCKCRFRLSSLFRGVPDRWRLGCRKL